MTHRFRLDGHVAIVTGVLGKLGPVWAKALLEAGAKVAGLDRRETADNNEFETLKEQYGSAIKFYQADVLDRSALEAVRTQVTAEFGTLTVLVNNAGIDQPPGPATTYRLEDVPIDIVQDVMAVNVMGAFQVMQVFGAPMAAAGKGSIINIGSLYAGVSPDARFYDHIEASPPFLKPPAYGASKAALVNLTRYFATHWGAQGVRVNTLSPGGVLGGQDPDFRQKFCDRVPLGRMAENDDLSGPLIFLASDVSSYVTGTELRVDGGYTAW